MSTAAMTPAARAIAAMTLQMPDQVPTFELGFTLAPEMFGVNLYPSELNRHVIHRLSPAEKDAKLHAVAADIARVFDTLDYCIIPGHYGAGYVDGTDISEERRFLWRKVKELTGGRRLLGYNADGTFAIAGQHAVPNFAYRAVHDAAGLQAEATQRMTQAIERNKHLAAAGVEVALLTADYAGPHGPFMTGPQFAQFVQPYLARIIEEAKREGMYTIKHTDGNIMPILEQLADCAPHALHSLDPTAGMDIKEVKAHVGHRVALCGNVDCTLLQDGPDEEAAASATYALTHGKPGGGYIFCTHNLPYRGIPPHRYQLVLDVWKQLRDYEKAAPL